MQEGARVQVEGSGGERNMLRENDTLRNEKLDGLFDGLCLLLFTEFNGHINLEQVARIPSFASFEHLVNGGEDHPGDSNDGPFLSSAPGDVLVLDAVIRGIL